MMADQRRQRPPQHPRINIDGVARIGGERHIALIQKGEVEVEDRLLGADCRDDLAAGVERHVEAAYVEVAQRLAEVGAPAV